MNTIPIIDGHIDLAWNKIALQRVFEESVEIKHKKDSKLIIQEEGSSAVGYPEIKSANVRVIFATIWVETCKSLYPTIGPKYHTLNEAKKLAYEQYYYYEDLCKKNKYCMIRSANELNEVLYSDSYKFGIVPIIEGADFVCSENDINNWIKKGIRIIAPVWQKNHFSGCSELGGDLTKRGRKLVKNLLDNHLLIDIAHMSETATESILELFEGVIINSHTTCRHFIEGERFISDSQIKGIHKHNGVIGLMTWKQKLKESSIVTIDDYIDHMCYIAMLTGTIDNIAIGSSMDGGYGVESLPKGMESIKSLDVLIERMQKRCFSESEIESILYKNWERVLLHSFLENTNKG